MSDPAATPAPAAAAPVTTAPAAPSVPSGEPTLPVASSATPAPSASTGPQPLHAQVAPHLEAIYHLTKDAAAAAATTTQTHETVMQELHDHLAAFEQNVANTLAKLRAAL